MLAERYVYSYGHRNIQGVAIRPETGEVYTAEHGPSNNDEVNRIESGRQLRLGPLAGRHRRLGTTRASR